MARLPSDALDTPDVLKSAASNPPLPAPVQAPSSPPPPPATPLLPVAAPALIEVNPLHESVGAPEGGEQVDIGALGSMEIPAVDLQSAGLPDVVCGLQGDPATGPTDTSASNEYQASETGVTIILHDGQLEEVPEGSSLPISTSTASSPDQMLCMDGFQFEEVPVHNLTGLGIPATMFGPGRPGRPDAPRTSKHPPQIQLALTNPSDGPAGGTAPERRTPFLRPGMTVALTQTAAPLLSGAGPTADRRVHNTSDSGGEDEMGLSSRLPSMPMSSVTDRLRAGRWMWARELKIYDLGDFRYNDQGISLTMLGSTFRACVRMHMLLITFL